MRTTFGKRAAAIPAVAVAAALMLSGCSGQATQSSSASTSTSAVATGGSVTIAMQGDITTFDPWASQSGLNGSLFALGGLYDSLLNLDESGQPVANVATKWESTDSSHYTLTLRDDVKFSDGTALNAEAVVKNVEYAQQAKTPGECNSYLTGATATAKDATTVEFSLKTPSVGFLTDLGSCASFVVNPKALTSGDSLKTTPDGSGPYTLDTSASVAGQKWVLTRNQDYWNKDAYPFDTINLIYFADSTAAANAAQSGQVDMIQSVDASKDTSGLKTMLTSTDFRGLMFQDISGKISKPLADVRVRQAMQYAIDRDAIKTALYPDSGELGYSTPFTSASSGFTDALKSTYTYDQAKAKQLLAEAGYPDGFTIKVMEVPSIYGDAAQAIAGQLAEVGIKLQLSDQSADFFNQLKSGKWPMITFNWTIGTNPVHTYEGLTSKSGFWNTFGNTSTTIEGLLTNLADAKDDAARQTILEQIAKAFQDESWYLVPVLVSGATAYNDQKLSVTHTQGSPVPFLYQIKKVG
jgi:peptide/nickel transport system substrate-binding protein